MENCALFGFKRMTKQVTYLKLALFERNVLVDNDLPFELLRSDYFWTEGPEDSICHISGIISNCYSLSFVDDEVYVADSQIAYVY